jgi:hypothetical protein
MDQTAEAIADFNMRNWTYAGTGAIRPGSAEHL